MSEVGNLFDKYHKPVRCARCGGGMIFKGVGEYACDTCGYIDYDDYGIVRNYIEENRGATVVEISAATGVSQSQIQAMLRDERLEVSEESRVFLKCVGCGREIRSGMYCPVCEKLAAAAAAKKRAREAHEAHKQFISGFENETRIGEDGAIRFRRER